MTVVKTQFKKISINRPDLKTNKIKLGQVKDDISIKDVRELDSTKGVKLDKKAIVFEYATNIDYSLEEPKGKSLGTIEIIGEIIDVEDESDVKDIIDNWKKNKKINPEILEMVLNIAFEESHVEALSLARKVGLPSPIPLPRLSTKQPAAKSG